MFDLFKNFLSCLDDSIVVGMLVNFFNFFLKSWVIRIIGCFTILNKNLVIDNIKLQLLSHLHFESLGFRCGITVTLLKWVLGHDINPTKPCANFSSLIFNLTFFSFGLTFVSYLFPLWTTFITLETFCYKNHRTKQ